MRELSIVSVKSVIDLEKLLYKLKKPQEVEIICKICILGK